MPGFKGAENGSPFLVKPAQEQLPEMDQATQVEQITRLPKGEPSNSEEEFLEAGYHHYRSMRDDAKASEYRAEDRLETLREEPMSFSGDKEVHSFYQSLEQAEQEVIAAKTKKEQLQQAVQSIERGTRPSEAFFDLVDQDIEDLNQTVNEAAEKMLQGKLHKRDHDNIRRALVAQISQLKEFKSLIAKYPDQGL